jgi:signal transduction histidine kinase
MPEIHSRNPSPNTARIWGAMLAAVIAVAAIAYWDAKREAAAALVDFAGFQITLARGLATTVTHNPTTAADPRTPETAHLRQVEIPGHLSVLVATKGRTGLVRTDGLVVRSPAIEVALAHGDSWAALSHDDAAALGFPPRTAVAGFAPLGSGATLAVVATAQEERDREFRAQLRLVLGVSLGACLVFAFGGLALRKQRQELALAHDLAVAEVCRARDEKLVRADKLATMGALATGIAHEVSTPLGVIVGRAEQLVPRVANDERARRSVEAILQQGHRIGRVIRGFLALARGEAPTFDDVDPATVSHTSVELVGHRFDKVGVHLDAHVPLGLPLISCEPRLVEQALANLLLNACDACKQGGRVTLEVCADAERVAFVVLDDGDGISAERAARAVEPFFTTKLPGSGTGLGLAITNEIVKHHRGTLTIEPRGDANGTRARIELPATRRNHEPVIDTLH